MRKRIDGIDVYYTESGNGDCVFVLQGWGTDTTVYKSVESVVSRGYRVVLFDMPGFGNTREPDEAWDVSAYTEFAVKFISSFSPERVILIGHSYGGRVIIKLMNMAELPFKVTKLVLIDAAGIVHEKSAGQKRRRRLYKAGKGVLSLPPVKAVFPKALDSLRAKMGSADYNNATETMRKALVLAVNEDLSGLLPGVNVPTLLFWGENDTATPIEDALLMEKQIPDAGLVRVPGAGHYSFLEAPALFERVICSFLKIGGANG